MIDVSVGTEERSIGSLPPANGKTVTERCIDALKSFARENGRAPTNRERKENPAQPKDVTLIRVFGSAAAAYAAAGLEQGHRPGAAVPPPVAEPEGHDEGRKQPAIASEPASAQASEGTSEGTLVELANGVERASQAVTVAEEALAQARRDLRDALTSLGSALEERQAAAA